jgi:Tfp pilus assembly protein PilV
MIFPKNKIKFRKFKKGFSIGEVMLSAFVLSIVLVTIIGIISTSIGHSIDSRNAIIASELAQEGVELVRNVRDNNWANTRSSFVGMDNGTYAIGYNDSALLLNGATILKYSNNNFYNRTTGNDTRFYRRITISGTSDEKTVNSMVIWGGSTFFSNTDCTTGHKCVYTELILNKWGEK